MRFDGGYVLLYRRLWNHPIFRDRIEAALFAWMICAAAWRPTRVRYKDIVVQLQRGELAVSVRDLAADWGWSKTKCARVIDRFEAGTLIGTASGTGVNVITICNYDKYQSSNEDAGTPEGTQVGTAVGHQRHTSGTQNKEEKESKKEKENNEDAIARAPPFSDGGSRLEVLPPIPASAIDTDDGFDEAWAAWPRKIAKSDAQKAYRASMKKVPAAVVLAAVHRFAEVVRRRRTEDRFIPYFAKWLRAERWNDEAPAVIVTVPTSGAAVDVFELARARVRAGGDS